MKMSPRNVAGFLRRAFALKQTRTVGAVGCEFLYKFTVTLNAEVFHLRKHAESEGVSATHVLVEKERNPGAGVACQINLQSQ